MPSAVRVSLAIVCAVLIAAPAAAKPRSGASATLSVHGNVLPGGRTTQAQSFKPLQIPIGTHKANESAKPSPSATPLFNPLRQRHMAMPVAPSGDLAF
jgi:hypothetical protein